MMMTFIQHGAMYTQVLQIIGCFAGILIVCSIWHDS